MLEKDFKFNWTYDCEVAFETLKSALCSGPILAYPAPDDPYIVENDASNSGIGAVLSQVQEGQEWVIAYFSKTLSSSERNYCTTRRELLAIIRVVKHFHHYLYGVNFLIWTENGALTWLLNFKQPEGQIARCLQFLSSYTFQIEHRPGTCHFNADALSGRPCIVDSCKHCSGQETNEADRLALVSAMMGLAHPINCHEKSTCISGLLDIQIRKAQMENATISLILKWKQVNYPRPEWTEISHLDPVVKSYVGSWQTLRVQNGVLYRKVHDPSQTNRLQLNLPISLRSMVTESLHSDITSGHLGVTRGSHIPWEE